MTKNLTQDYTNYIDSADMIIEYYKNQQTSGLEKYFLDIENWLSKDINEDQNKPLVIQAEEGVGKKTLLVKWMEYHQQNSKKAFKDLIIPHFAGTGGNNSNYYYAIYKILIKIREAFNISQKVELLEEKLRKYFYYWLDVCSRSIKSQVVNDSVIILIFEGINLFNEFETGEEAQISMWLPEVFPDRVRVIVTADPKSQAIDAFRKNKCEIILIHNEKLVIDNVIKAHLNRPLYIIDDDYKNQIISILNHHYSTTNLPSLFVKTYLSCLLPYPSAHIIDESDINKQEFKKIFDKIDLELLKTLNTMPSLFDYLLDYFSKALMPEEKFIKTISILSLTQKGLSINEITSITNINSGEWHYLIAIFKTFLMKYKGFWKINNEIFKAVIVRKYLQNTKHTLDLHEKIAEVLEKVPNSIKKLEEQTYHLFVGKNFFKLKEAVSNIENFLLLFNPNNKYDLCRYWQILQEKGFDPSMEYTKQIESFEMHYRPTPDDTFRIMIQISRFLKEFSDFETELTPRFRHPPIKLFLSLLNFSQSSLSRGGKELTEIGIRKEIKKMEMLVAEEIGENEEDIDEMEELAFELHGELKGSKLLESAKDIVKEIHDNLKAQKGTQQNKQAQSKTALPNANEPTNNAPQKNLLNPIEKAESVKKNNSHTKNKYPPILDAIESLNVDIPDNRIKFRDYYLKSLADNDDPTQVEAEVPNKLGLVTKDEIIHNSDNEKDNDEEDTHKSLQSQNFLSNIVTNKSKQDLHTGFNKIAKIKPTEEKLPTYYYYKRWLWMMFPWACLAHRANFSQIIFECFSSPTRYMSVAEERKYTQEALRITIEAKMKKKAMYARPDDTNKDDQSVSNSNLPSSRAEILVDNPRKSIIRRSIMNHIGFQFDLGEISKSKNFEMNTISEGFGSPQSSTNQLDNQFGSIKSKRIDQKQFFITTEFLNLNTLNNSVNAYSAKFDSKSPLSLGESSIHLLNKSLAKSKTVRHGLSIDKGFEKMVREASYPDANILLPKFQSNMQEKNDRELAIFDSKIQKLQKELNDLTYKNKTLARRLKELAVNKHSLTTAIGTEGVESVKNKILSLGQQIDKVKKVLNESTSEQNRLKKIIFVCHKNKKQNETWIRELNYLLQNLKKMIKWENETKSKLEMQITDMKKLLESYAKAYNDKFMNHQALIEHLKTRVEAKDAITQKIEDVDNQLESSALEVMEKINHTYKSPLHSKDQKYKMQQVEKNAKATQERLDQLTELYQKAKIIIGDKNEDYEHTPQFQDFLTNITKKNDLERIIFEKNEGIKDIQEKIKEKKLFLETLQKASVGKRVKPQNQNNSKDDADFDKSYFEDILRNKKTKNEHMTWKFQKNTQILLDSQMILQKIAGPLGIDFTPEKMKQEGIPTEEITNRFDVLLTRIKDNLDEETFEKFKSHQFDFTIFYQKISYNSSTFGSNNFPINENSSRQLKKENLNEESSTQPVKVTFE